MNNNVTDKINDLLILLQKDKENAFYCQLKNHLEMYKRSTDYLKEKEHKIAFIGNVGAGKTTGMCHLLGLINDKTPILSTGSGRTTLCEVHIKYSKEEKVIVTPCSDDEVYSYLYDFSLYLKSENRDKEQEGFKLSAEIERALRNMLDLKVIRNKVNGKRTVIDYARILSVQFESVVDLYDEFKNRIDLPNRTKNEFINENDEDSMKWLHQTFKLINSATHQNVGLAKKITIFSSSLVNFGTDYSVTFIDTKGVDQTVNRVDLDKCLTDDKTISVFCSRFNDAPDQTCSKMVDSSIQAGLKSRLNSESLLLVLDREGEAEDVMDYDEAVGDKDDGRDIKEEQIAGELSQRYAVYDLDIVFFDAKQDSPQDLLNSLMHKVNGLRERHKVLLQEIDVSVCELESEIKNQTESVVMRQVVLTLEPWLKKTKFCTPTLSEYFVPLIEAILSKGTYAASVRASVNRDGEWQRLDYYHELAVAARKQCNHKINPLKDELTILINNMLDRKELKSAHSLLKQLKNTTDIRLDKINQLALLKGRSVYESYLKSDDEFWDKNKNEWGQGAGYKNRIATHSQNWFKANDYSRFEFEVTRGLVEHWENYIKEIEKLIGTFSK